MPRLHSSGDADPRSGFKIDQGSEWNGHSFTYNKIPSTVHISLCIRSTLQVSLNSKRMNQYPLGQRRCQCSILFLLYCRPLGSWQDLQTCNCCTVQ